MNDAQATNPRSELAVGIVIVFIGIFFLISAADIPSNSGDAFGARSLPRAISVLLITLGTLWAALSLRKIRRSGSGSKPNSRNRFLLTRIVPLLLLSFLYGFLFDWFGYLVATFAIMGPVLFIYGTRSAPKLLAVAASATAVYYLLFIKVMGVFDAGGSVINFNELLGL